MLELKGFTQILLYESASYKGKALFTQGSSERCKEVTTFRIIPPLNYEQLCFTCRSMRAGYLLILDVCVSWDKTSTFAGADRGNEEEEANGLGMMIARGSTVRDPLSIQR